jgi:hypothetical protein
MTLEAAGSGEGGIRKLFTLGGLPRSSRTERGLA